MERLIESALKAKKKDELITLINELYGELDKQDTNEQKVDIDKLNELCKSLKPVKFGLISDKTKNLIHEDTLKEFQKFVREDN